MFNGYPETVRATTLTRYLVRLFLMRFLFVLILLVSILQALDLLNKSDDILEVAGAGWGSVANYIMLRAPQLASQFTPFAALLATLITLGTLNQNSEIVVMRAAGLSTHRILFPLGMACAIIFVFHMLLHEAFVVKSSARLDFWERNNFALDLELKPDSQQEIWLQEGNSVVNARWITQTVDSIILDKVTVYEKDGDGLLQGTATAEFASYRNGRWTLFDVMRLNAADLSTTTAETEAWQVDLRPDKLAALALKPEWTYLVTLIQNIRQFREAGLSTGHLDLAWFQRFSGPAASLVMPLMGAVAGFGVHRHGALLLRIVVGAALGFSYFVSENFMIAMGQFGVMPPIVSAFAPLTFTLLCGFSILFFTEE